MLFDLSARQARQAESANVPLGAQTL